MNSTRYACSLDEPKFVDRRAIWANPSGAGSDPIATRPKEVRSPARGEQRTRPSQL